jgi:hypothetical protein
MHVQQKPESESPRQVHREGCVSKTVRKQERRKQPRIMRGQRHKCSCASSKKVESLLTTRMTCCLQSVRILLLRMINDSTWGRRSTAAAAKLPAGVPSTVPSTVLAVHPGLIVPARWPLLGTKGVQIAGSLSQASSIYHRPIDTRLAVCTPWEHGDERLLW